jgi:dihydrofolate synthase/folylpolyglutamate synthase
LKEERKELLQWLFSLENAGIKFGLDNIKELLRRLGNPQDDYRTIHITGTNGKGSVCAQIAAALQSEGLKTGLYTSPHLVEFEERIMVNNKEIGSDELVNLIYEIKDVAQDMLSEPRRLTFFEFTTALAFLYFQRCDIDVGVIEVGLGGRLDATNVITPLISVITHVDLEHTEYLGNTLASIAFEKAGIIKRGVPVVTHEWKKEPLDVIRSVAAEREAQLICGEDLALVKEVENSWGKLLVDIEGEHEYRNVNSALWGSYQIENISTSVTALEQLGRRGIFLTDQDIRDGIEKAHLPGRMQCAKNEKEFLFDVAHNPDAMRSLVDTLKKLSDERYTIVLGVLSDKDIVTMLSYLAKIAKRIICTEPKSPRARKAEELAMQAQRLGIETRIEKNVSEAMETALEMEGERVIVTGSFRTVGEAMQWWSSTYGKKLWKP